MAEENINVTTKQETSEVVSLPGLEGGATVKAVSSMFDKILEGKQSGKTAKEVVAENPPGDDVSVITSKKDLRKREEKKVEKATEAKPAEKTELEKKVEPKPEPEKGSIRDSLKKSTEPKVEEEVKVEAEPDKKADDEISDADLSGVKDKTRKRIQALLNKVKVTEELAATTKKEASEKAQKLAELEKKLGEQKTVDPKTDEEVKKQLEELSMYRRRYELDKTPELKTKYDDRVTSAEKSIIDTLVSNRLGEGLIKQIQHEGGWVNFAQSGKPITIGGADGENKVVTMAEVADMILQALPLGERKSVEAYMLEQVQLKRDKDRFIKEESDKATEFFKKQEEEAVKRSADQKKQLEDGAKFVEEYRKKTFESEPWAKDKEIPEKATAAEKQEIEDHNKYNQQLRDLFEKSMVTPDLPGLVEIITDSVRYYDERRTNSVLKRQIKSLEKELESQRLEVAKIKRGGNSVPRPGSIAPSANIEKKAEEDERPRDIGSAFDHIARHGKGSLRQVLTNDDE